MSDMPKRYLQTVVERLSQVMNTQTDAIEEAARACAQSILDDKLVFTFGTGHGSFAAMEMYPRTGTVTGFRPIVESSMISFHRVLGDAGARQYRFIHAQEHVPVSEVALSDWWRRRIVATFAFPRQRRACP